MGYVVFNSVRGWQAELTIGTMVGYDGPEVVSPKDVGELLTEFDRTGFAVCLWTRGTMFYGEIRETVIKVTVHAPNASYYELWHFSCGLAAFLADRLKQERIYVNVTEVTTTVVGKA